MSLTNTDVVDLITHPLPGDDCDLVLYIVDGGEVSDEIERVTLLQRKLRTYVGYVASDLFAEEFPAVEPRRVLLRVVCKSEPNQVMVDMQAIRARHDERVRIPIVFIGWDEFTQSLKDKRNLPNN